MIPRTGNCYQVQCTTGVTVTDTNYLQSVVLPGGRSSNLIYNDLYLIVCLRKLLLLSGDVELNPGPMIDDRPDISLLLQWLEPLVDWKPFGLLLPGITQQDITAIEDFEIDTEQSKEGLFSKWLKKNPTATWRDVLNALTKREEINLLQTINDQLQVHQCTGGNDDTPTNTPVVSTVSSSVSVINKPVTSTTSGYTPHNVIYPFLSKAGEMEVYKSLDDLHQKFSNLAKVFKMSLQEKVNHNSQLATDVSEWLIAYMEWEHGPVDNNLDDILRKIRPYYDFIDCRLLLDMSNEFLQDVTFIDDGVTYKLVNELHSHTLMSKSLRISNTVATLKKLLQEHYKPFEKNMDNLPYIHIQLQTCWDDLSINGLYILIEKLLPQEYRQSIIKHIHIISA